MSLHAKDSDEIAIVGLGCRFAGVNGPAALWDQAMSCRSDFSDHADAAAARVVDPTARQFARLPTIRGGYLHDLYAVDPDLPVLTAGDVAAENTDELFLAQLIADALRDAGFTLRSATLGRVALAVGYAPPFTPASAAWLMQASFAEQIISLLQRFFAHASNHDRNALRKHFQQALPPVSAPLIGHAYPHALAAHIAGRFGFGGAAMVVNAGDVSALAAIRAAVDDLRLHRSDLALAAALQGPIPLAALFGIAALHPLTAHDTPLPFSRDAVGTLPGEGGGVLVLRRRADAERNGERIYALIKGVAIASGAAPAQPNAMSDIVSRVISDTFRQAGVSLDTCTYLETHGTGISADDTAELEALCDIFGERTGFQSRLALGTTKAALGHTFAAAGMASVCKTVWALTQRVIPPAIVGAPSHPHLSLPHVPFYLPTEPRPWINSRNLAPRRAGVTVWDGEGLAAHCLLEEQPEVS